MMHIILCSDQVDPIPVLKRYRDRFSDGEVCVSACKTEQALSEVLGRAGRQRAAEQESFFTVTTRMGRSSIPISDIVYCRSGQHSFQIYLADGTVVSSRTTRCSFPTSVAPLLETGFFLHCERSVVVNLRFVKMIQANGILLYDGTLLPYPQTRRKRCPVPSGFAVGGAGETL